MEKIYPYGETSGDFVDADVTNSVRGSKVPAQFFNEVQAEIIAAIEAAGLTPDASNLTQLAEAIQVIAGSGGGSNNYATTAYVDSAVAGVESLGVGQTWQDVISQRASNITYTNNSGLPISVSITLIDSLSANLKLYIDGNLMAERKIGNGASAILGFDFIVPNGSDYKIESNETIYKWWELK